MTKQKMLDILMVISALESWAYAQKAAFPDYLIEEVAQAVEALKEAILKDDYKCPSDIYWCVALDFGGKK